ncbi:MAG TPA: hypothetical protein IAC25_05615 [Candidatus Enterenecus stercoripullorum]|nr:hypothetical protein [Candidatus Enterenecus stercoripullorum]
MAMLERTLTGNFSHIVQYLHDSVLNKSASASYEEGSDFTMGSTRVAIRMYERYSWTGSNRVAMSVTIVGEGNRVHVTAITAGGSQGVFLKLNTFGEESFLDTLAQALDEL